MAQKLEDIKRDGGFIRVGSTGTIGSLMSKELDSWTSLSSSSSVTGLRLGPDSMSGNDSISNLKKSMDEEQSTSVKQGNPESTRLQSRSQTQHHIPDMGLNSSKRMHRVPMLGSENATPKREKPARKVFLVEVADTNCGVPFVSLSNRFKKLSFSKLSHSVI